MLEVQEIPKIDDQIFDYQIFIDVIKSATSNRRSAIFYQDDYRYEDTAVSDVGTNEINQYGIYKLIRTYYNNDLGLQFWASYSKGFTYVIGDPHAVDNITFYDLPSDEQWGFTDDNEIFSRFNCIPDFHYIFKWLGIMSKIKSLPERLINFAPKVPWEIQLMSDNAPDARFTGIMLARNTFSTYRVYKTVGGKFVCYTNKASGSNYSIVNCVEEIVGQFGYSAEAKETYYKLGLDCAIDIA